LAAREDQLPAGLMASYELVARILIRALDALGVEAVASSPPLRREVFQHRFQVDPKRGVRRPQRGDFDCFARPAGREVCVGGRKLAGSAQRRAKGGILQHGSIRLAPDPLEVRRATSLDGAGATSLLELGANSDPEVLLAACVEAFEQVLGALEVGALSAEDRVGADERARNHQRDSGFAAPAYTQGASRQPIADR
jgi:lipoate-protein ligase A